MNRICPTCKKYPAIIETIPCRIDETEEYEQWLIIDAIECDEEEFIALRNTIDRMREQIETAKNKEEWDGNHRIFTRENIHSCRKCQKEQDKNYQTKVIIPQQLTEAGVKKEHLSAHLNDCGKWVIEYTDKSLFLFGSTGVGKTHAMVALLRHDITNNKAVAFTSTFNLLQMIRGSFSQAGGQTEQQLIDYYSTIPNLYLDDISAERPTDWALATLCSILDSRYNDKLRTIITANTDFSELYQIFGDRIVSRIMGICGTPVKLNGKDRRLPDK